MFVQKSRIDLYRMVGPMQISMGLRASRSLGDLFKQKPWGQTLGAKPWGPSPGAKPWGPSPGGVRISKRTYRKHTRIIQHVKLPKESCMYNTKSEMQLSKTYTYNTLSEMQLSKTYTYNTKREIAKGKLHV